jgi:phenylacetate-CoA ligase
MHQDHIFTDLPSLGAARERAFHTTMDLVCERHDFYRERMVQSGLNRSSFSSLADLSRMPLTLKSDYMASPERFVLDTAGLSLEERSVWDTMYTTGSTSGQPTPFVSTSFDFFNILTLQRNMLLLRGVTGSDVIANLFPLTQVPHGAWIRVLHAAASLNVPVVSVMPGNPSAEFKLGNSLDRVVSLVAERKSTILWGVPSYVFRVLQRAAELKVTFESVRLVFVTGEALSETARHDMQQALVSAGAMQASISISYGATELQGGLVECAPGTGYHNPLPAQMLFEVVDPVTHQPVPDGELGWVVLSHLHRRGTVLLRYALGDTSVVTREPCPHCGAVTDRLVQMPQRADGLLKIKGMLVNPGVVVQAIDALLGATPYLVTVAAAMPGQELAGDVMRLQTESVPSDALKLSLVQSIKQACGITAEVLFVPAQSLMAQGTSWKARKFTDLRKH